MINAIPFILLTAIFWSSVNYIDKYLIEKIALNKGIGSLVIFSGIIGLPAAILIYFFNNNVLAVALLDATWAVFAGIIFLISLIPYLKALDKESATTVSPMFILIPVFAGFMSWVFLNEVLNNWQILGSLLITFSTALLSVKTHKHRKKKIWKINFKLLILMGIASFLQASVTVIFKAVSLEEQFWTAAFYENIGLFIAGVSFFIFNKKYKKDFLKVLKKKSGAITILNINNEIANTAGNLCFRMAFLIAPIAVVEVITEAIQPFILLIMGIILTTFLPSFSTEKIEKNEIIRKLKIFMLTAVGIFIVNIH